MSGESEERINTRNREVSDSATTRMERMARRYDLMVGALFAAALGATVTVPRRGFVGRF